MSISLPDIRAIGNDEEAAYALLESMRWPTGPECPHCGYDKAYFLTPKNPEGRRSGPKRTRSIRRVWKCAKCRKQFSVLTNTIFHGTKIPICDWLHVMVQMSASKNGTSAREIERMIHVTPETAWFMLHRLREAMRRESIIAPLSGVVAADETYIGGIEANKHKDKRFRNVYTAEPTRIEPGNRPRQGPGPSWGKTSVLTLVDRETGEARSKVVPDVTAHSLRKAIAEQVDMPNTILHTDESRSYQAIAHEFKDHQSVVHSDDQYVRVQDGRKITSNQVENFFSQLKRSIDGTYHHVSKKHLQRYLDEFDFRYTTRRLTDSARLQRMVDQAAGRRLTYKPLTDG